jgi:DHA1 family tetracycline resistance protein-like MFS transporter
MNEPAPDPPSTSTSPSSPSSSSPSSNGRVLGVVFLTLFLDLLGFGVILPIQPFYAESFGASATVVTLIGATYSLMQFVFAPVWGRLSDRVGRRPVVLVSVAFAFAGWMVLGFANALWMLVLSRAIAGFGNANLGTVQAIVADVTKPEERAKGMGLIGAAFGLGFLFGPIVGGVFGSMYGPQVPAFIAAGLAALNWVLAALILPETKKPSTSTSAPPPELRRSLFPFAAMREAGRIPGVTPLLAMGFVFTVGFSLMEAALSLFLEREYLPASLIGTEEGGKQAASLAMQVLVTVGVTAVLVQGGAIRRLRVSFTEKQLLLAGSVLIAVGFALWAALPFLHLPFAANFPITILIACGSGVFSPSSSSLLSRTADEQRQGMVLGVGQAVSSLGRIFGPAMSGFLLDLHRSLPFALGAVLLAIAAALATRVLAPTTTSTAPSTPH